MREWGLPGLAALDASQSVLWVSLGLTRRAALGEADETTGSHDATGTLLTPHLLPVRARFEARSRTWLSSSSVGRSHRLDDIHIRPRCRQKKRVPFVKRSTTTGRRGCIIRRTQEEDSPHHLCS